MLNFVSGYDYFSTLLSFVFPFCKRILKVPVVPPYTRDLKVEKRTLRFFEPIRQFPPATVV